MADSVYKLQCPIIVDVLLPPPSANRTYGAGDFWSVLLELQNQEVVAVGVGFGDIWQVTGGTCHVTLNVSHDKHFFLLIIQSAHIEIFSVSSVRDVNLKNKGIKPGRCSSLNLLIFFFNSTGNIATWTNLLVWNLLKQTYMSYIFIQHNFLTMCTTYSGI